MTINSNRFFIFILRNLTLLFVCLFTLALLVDASTPTSSSHSEDNIFKLTKVAQLNHKNISAETWQQLVANPANNQQYFAINEGGLYLVDGSEIIPQALLELSNETSNPELKVKLTAFALHPNFALRDKIGYSTFYTAHLETIDNKSKIKKIQPVNIDVSLAFDAVVTEWKFNLLNHQKVDLTTKREILRIAVPDNKTVIKQLAFNPFIKSWNDNFGLLYIAIDGQKKWSQPLYSGAILRIHPAKFGLRSFTIPLSNPFLNNNLVHDVIYLFGSQSIKKFIWPNKSSDQILLHHEYDRKQLLSYSKGGNNWRDNVPKNVLPHGNSTINDIFIYQGRKSPHLRNKLLLLNHQNEQWKISSLSLKTSDNQKNDEPLLKLIWRLPVNQLSNSQSIKILSYRSGEMLLFDKMGGMLYQLSQQNIDFITPVATESQSDNSKIYFFILLFFAFCLLGYYFIKRNKFSVKALVKQQFSRLEISESELQISLYHRHETSTNTVIDIIDIESCEIFLNDHSINIIDTISGHGFNNEKEHDLRATFTKEHIDKMVDGKVRVISLQIVDKQKKHYDICLYLRKGSNRMTKKGYFNVIDELVDWCWLIAKKINSDKPSIRAIKSVNKTAQEDKVKREAEAKIPLHTQATAIRPATHKVIKAELNEAIAEVKNIKQPVNTQSSDEQKSSATKNNTINTEVVDALEKLVSLKQQGYLTTAEFVQAKEKLLQSLFDK